MHAPRWPSRWAHLLLQCLEPQQSPVRQAATRWRTLLRRRYWRQSRRRLETGKVPLVRRPVDRQVARPVKRVKRAVAALMQLVPHKVRRLVHRVGQQQQLGPAAGSKAACRLAVVTVGQVGQLQGRVCQRRNGGPTCLGISLVHHRHPLWWNRR